jgi:cell division protein FtsW
MTLETHIARWWKGLDKGALITLALISFIGLFAAISTSSHQAVRIKTDAGFFLIKYFWYIWPGVISLITLSMLSTKWIKRLAVAGSGAFLVLCFATQAFRAVKGANRWIFIPGFSLQPSEFLKAFAAILTSMLIIKIKNSRGDVRKKWLIVLGGFYGLIAIALFMQPDFGMLLTFATMLAAQALVAGLSWKWIGVGIAGLAGLAAAAYNFLPHVAVRVAGFLSGSSPGAKRQIDYALDTIKNAGFFGHTSSTRGSIPDVHTDFVFSAIAEKFGIIVALIPVVLYFIFGLAALARIRELKNPFNVIAATGIITYLMFQVVVNLMSNLGLIPPKGMTLPFISYGGSSFVSSAIAAGLLIALLQEYNARPERNNEKK